jgi:DNA-binding transcriptional ArsR family regulator
MMKATGMTDTEFYRIGKALADPKRFRILQELTARTDEMLCQALLHEVRVAPATMSHHLKELITAGLIDSRKDGQHLVLWANRPAIARYERELATRLNNKQG